MPRRRNSSVAEDLIDIASHLPWWVCLAIAFVGYFGCHAIASRPLSLAPGANPSSLYVPMIFRGLAMAGQYIVPIVFVVGAVLSLFRRRQRANLLAETSVPNASSVIDKLSWQKFKLLVGEAYRRRGYQVEERGGASADGGIDLVLTRPAQSGREKVLVQCKQWRARRVGVDVVRELYGVMAATGASAGIVVTSGSYTEEATAFASGRNLTLLDGPRLVELIGPVERPIAREAGAAAVPACPRCSKPMVKRMARQGAQAGSAFWGCSEFPGCRGTRPIS